MVNFSCFLLPPPTVNSSIMLSLRDETPTKKCLKLKNSSLTSTSQHFVMIVAFGLDLHWFLLLLIVGNF